MSRKDRSRRGKQSKENRLDGQPRAAATPPTDPVPEWLKSSTCPREYPAWLKSVYTDLEKMIALSRANPSVTTEQFVNWVTMSKRMCHYMYLSAGHLTKISTIGLEDAGNLTLVETILEKYDEATAAITAQAEPEE